MNAERFNALYEVGVPVFAYPGCRPEDVPNAPRLVTRTRTKAQSVGLDREGVVWVDGHSACIALTHVDVVSETVFEAAKQAEWAASVSAAAKPQPASDDPRDVEIALLQRKVASLKELQAKDDAEYAEAIAERDRARTALREACDQIAALESDLGGAMARASALQQRLHEAAMTKVWVNEDGKRFVFLEDIAPVLLGTKSGTEAAS